ncbi:MAG: glycosyltransferase family 4 protein [Lachnospiraceae bacterium]
MKILVICQYYYPEPFRITDICETLIKQGHEVTVLTGLPNYPEGIIPNEYKHGKLRRENHNGVKIIRTFEIARKNGLIFRFFNYYSFSFSSQRAVTRLDKDFDIVFVNQLSPVMMANAAIKYKKKHGTKILLYCLDLWPESLVAGGISRDSFVYKCFLKTSKKIYKSVDKIAITSKGFEKYFEKVLDIKNKNIVYLPQYAEDIFEKSLPCDDEKDTYDFVFAGNIGNMQSVETIVLAANELTENSQIKFHIFGDGSELENCKKLAYGLNNIRFYGRLQVSEMPKIYSLASAMLVTLKDNKAMSFTLPGKIQSYMAAGKPIIGAIGGETAQIINEANCGLCGPAEEYKSLANNILEFVENKEQMDRYGENAKKFYIKNFSKERFIKKLMEEIKELRM